MTKTHAEIRAIYNKALAALVIYCIANKSRENNEGAVKALKAFREEVKPLLDFVRAEYAEGRTYSDGTDFTSEEGVIAGRMCLVATYLDGGNPLLAAVHAATLEASLPPAKITFTLDDPGADVCPCDDCCGDEDCDDCHDDEGEVADGPNPEEEMRGLISEVADLQDERARLVERVGYLLRRLKTARLWLDVLAGRDTFADGKYAAEGYAKTYAAGASDCLKRDVEG